MKNPVNLLAAEGTRERYRGMRMVAQGIVFQQDDILVSLREAGTENVDNLLENLILGMRAIRNKVKDRYPPHYIRRLDLLDQQYPLLAFSNESRKESRHA